MTTPAATVREALESLKHASCITCGVRGGKHLIIAHVGKEFPTVDAALAALTALEQERDKLLASRRVPELDNHHNALACGYCSGPLKARAEQAEAALARVRQLPEKWLPQQWDATIEAMAKAIYDHDMSRYPMSGWIAWSSVTAPIIRNRYLESAHDALVAALSACPPPEVRHE